MCIIVIIKLFERQTSAERGWCGHEKFRIVYLCWSRSKYLLCVADMVVEKGFWTCFIIVRNTDKHFSSANTRTITLLHKIKDMLCVISDLCAVIKILLRWVMRKYGTTSDSTSSPFAWYVHRLQIAVSNNEKTLLEVYVMNYTIWLSLKWVVLWKRRHY